MRKIATIATAVAALAGLSWAASQPAAAFDDTYPRPVPLYRSAVTIHHHIYLPPRYRHVYHIHRGGPEYAYFEPIRARRWGWRYEEVRLGGYFAPSRSTYRSYRRAHWMK